VSDEKELATEVLLNRHRFTGLVRKTQLFRQATLTVIQNIYLFQNRKIFFGTTALSSEQERQEALFLFSEERNKRPVSLAQTFQHLILARIWNRILSTSDAAAFDDYNFKELHEIIERLNTLRNIYILLSTNIVKKLASKINTVYKQSISYEDAVQIGSFGIARASYRFHQSCGVRFSTYAANWVFKEIQRQALAGRLIKISSNTVEQYTKAAKEGNEHKMSRFSTILNETKPGELKQETSDTAGLISFVQPTKCPADEAETRQLYAILIKAIDQILPAKSGDIIKRRYGLPPYYGNAQSVIEISKQYKVSRGAIYQREQQSLKKLNFHLKETIA
jgi:RNA polymerase sigma factor (sigma-70 family)